MSIASPAVLKMIKPWLTGDDEKDAKMLRKMFRGCKMSIGEWRQVVAESKAAN
jgi:hypothetical protein